MISQKIQLFFLPVVVFIMLLVLDSGWIYALIMAGAVTLGGTIGYLGKFGLWGASSKSRFTASKFLIVIGIVLIVFLWIPDFMNLSLWRQIIGTIFVLLISAFDLTDSYLWYKKEQQELHNKEMQNG